MFNPPILKFKKLKKGNFRNKELNKKSSQLQFGEYGLQFLHKGFLTPSQIEATRKIIAKNIKGIGKLWINRKPNIPRTRKPLEFRMGKGKGSVSHWVLNIKAGFILFEISFLGSNKPNLDFLKKAAKKLPIRCKVIFS